MQIMIAFVLLFSLLTNSVAANVTIYNSLNYFVAAPGTAIPRAVSDTPWRFGFEPENYSLIYVKAITESPGMKWTVTFTTNNGTMNSETERVGKYKFISGHFKSTDIAIRLDVFRNGEFCSSQLLAEGRTHWQGNKDPRSRDICGGVCVLEVNITSECVDPSPVTSNTTTVTSVVHIKEKTNNNSATTSPPLVNKSEITTMVHAVIENVTSPDNIIETTTIKVTKNSGNSTTTDNSTVIIIVSSFGVVVVLIVIVVGCKCWVKQNASGTPRLPTTAQSEPFYLNLLFRRECDQEIAEIEQHHYETIEEQQNGETEIIYDVPY